MTDESSPFYSYDRSSVGWLYPRKEQGLDILNEDLARIVEANADVVADPLLRELIVEGLRGQLHAKRGRKRLPSRVARDLYIVSLYDDLLPRLQARARKRSAAGEKKWAVNLAPAEKAYAVIGRYMGMAPERVRNIVSQIRGR